MLVLALACAWDPSDIDYPSYLAALEALDTGVPEGFGACSEPRGEAADVTLRNDQGPLVEVLWVGEDCTVTSSAVLFSDTPRPPRPTFAGEVFRVRTAGTSPDFQPTWVGEYVVTEDDLAAGTIEVGG